MAMCALDKWVVANNLGAEIADYLTRTGRTQVELADAVGVTPSAISRWKARRQLPELVHLPALAAAIGRPLAKLRALWQAEQDERTGQPKVTIAELEQRVRRLEEQQEAARASAAVPGGRRGRRSGSS